MKSLKVAVGSKNPVKIEAVRQAFSTVFPDQKWEIVGVDVDSGVSNQPMSDRESIKGARNRAKKSLRKLKADFGAGLEGGLHKIHKSWFDSGWIIIIDKKGDEGIGSTVRLNTPDTFMKHVFEGIELGVVDDIIFKKHNSKHTDGHFGLMTRNGFTRISAYRDGVISALSRFIHPHLF